MPSNQLRTKTRSKSPAKTPRRHASPRRHKADTPAARAVMQRNSSSPTKRRSTQPSTGSNAANEAPSPSPPSNSTSQKSDDPIDSSHSAPTQRTTSTSTDTAPVGNQGGNEGQSDVTNHGQKDQGTQGSRGGRGGRGGRGSVAGIMAQYNSLSKNNKNTKNKKSNENEEKKDEEDLAQRMSNNSIDDDSPDLNEGLTFDSADDDLSDASYNPEEDDAQDVSDVEMLDAEEGDDDNSKDEREKDNDDDDCDGDAPGNDDQNNDEATNKEEEDNNGEEQVEDNDAGTKEDDDDVDMMEQDDESLIEPHADPDAPAETEEQARQRKITEQLQDAETIEKLIADAANESWEEDQAALPSARSSKRAAEKLPPKKGVSFKSAVCSKGVEKKDEALQSRRLRVMIKIAEPTDKSDMLNKIRDKLNDLLDRIHVAMTRVAGVKELRTPQSKKYFFLREFQDKSRPSFRNRALQKWITTVPNQPSFDWFRTYFQGGMSQYQKHRGGQFYFRVSAVFPSKWTVDIVLSEIRFQLDNPEERSVTDILSQMITDPVKIGLLVRSHGKMTQSDDLQIEIQRFAPRGVYIGLQFGNVPLPYGQKHSEKTKRIRAVIIETNQDTLEAASRFMLQLFPANRKKVIKSIFGVNMVFVYSVHHPQIKDLPHAVTNVMTLMNRHRRSLALMHHMECTKLIPAALDEKIYSDDNETLRDRLMSTKVTVTEDSIGGKLFHSIIRSQFRGKYTVWFTCHEKLKSEASAVVGGIVEFIRDELGLDVSRFFAEYDIDDDAEWDPITRTLNNEATRATDAWLEATQDLDGDDTDSDEEVEVVEIDEQSTALNSMDKREMERMTGLNDEETVVNVKAKKAAKPAPKKPTDPSRLMGTIDMDPNSDNCSTAASSVGMGSTYSKTNQAKAELRQEMEEKFAAQEQATQARIAHLERLLAQAMGQGPPAATTDTTNNNAGSAMPADNSSTSANTQSNASNSNDEPNSNSANPDSEMDVDPAPNEENPNGTGADPGEHP